MPDLLPILASQDPGYTPINNRPGLVVEIAFNAGYLTAAVDRVWTDVTDYVDLGSLSVERGRQDNEGQVGPSRLSLTFDNRDGRFTPEYAGGAYFPNVKRGRPIRVSAVSVLGTTFILCVGYLDSVAVQWPGGSDAYATALISGTSRMARLGKSGAFRSVVEEEVLYDDPIFYWTLAEPQGATEAGNIAAGRPDRLSVIQVGSGGTLEFGAGTGPGTDDLTAPTLTPASLSNGLFLGATIVEPISATSTTQYQLECWFVATGECDILVALTADKNMHNALNLGIAVNKAIARVGGIVAPPSVSVNSVASVNDGLLHHAVLKASVSGGNVTLTLIVDGVTSSSAATAAPVTDYGFVRVGGHDALIAPVNLLNGTIAHVAVYAQTSTAVTDARFIEHYNAGTNGFTADGSEDRIARYARYAGIPTAETIIETGLSTSIAHKDVTGVAPLEAMEAVRLTEDGVLFDGKDGTLTFHARSHRYNSTSAFTLDFEAQDVEADFSPKLDDQGVTNDVKASRPLGSEAHAVNQASIDEIGYYRDSIEVLTTSDNEVQSRADWEVNRRGTPRTKAPDVKVSLAGCPPSLIDSLLAADIGTRFTLTNLPAQASVSTIDFFIEGISHEIGAEDWTISFNTSRVELANVWVLDSASYSQLDSTTILAY